MIQVGQVCVLKTEVREQVKMSERFKHNHVATGVKNKVFCLSLWNIIEFLSNVLSFN